MKPDKLFDLIHAMTMSEKRHFKVFSNRHTIGDKNQYLELFDYIDKQKTLDHKELEQQPFVKNLSAEKNYLYRMILKGLNAYYYDFSYKTRVQNLLTNAEILAYKGLEFQALKLLQKAGKLAETAELFPQWLTVKQTEFELLSKRSDYGAALDRLEEAQAIGDQYEALSNIQQQVTNLYKERRQHGGIRSEHEMAELEGIAANSDAFHSKKSLLFQQSFKVAYHQARKDYEQKLTALQQIIALYENNSFLVEYSTKGYLLSLYNLANTYRMMGKFELSAEVLDQMSGLLSSKLVAASKALGAQAFYLSNSLRLYLYLLQQQFDAAVAHYHVIQKQYKLYESNVDQSMLYEHLMLVIRIHMELSDFKTALKHSNSIINDTSFKQREDILTYVRLLNLVIHFELNNDFTVDYLSASTLHYLKKKQRLFKTEQEVINFMMKFYDGKQKVLQSIHTRLKDLKQDPYESVMFRFFDFEQWVSQKLAKQSKRTK